METYGQMVERLMRSTENAQGRQLSILDVANATGMSREHVRKIVRGVPTGSRHVNDALAALLGFDAAAGWSMLQSDKARHRYGVSLPPVQGGADSMPSYPGRQERGIAAEANPKGSGPTEWEASLSRLEVDQVARKLRQIEEELEGVRRIVSGLNARLESRPSMSWEVRESSSPYGSPSATRRRRPMSPDTKRRISEGQRRRWEKVRLERASVGHPPPSEPTK